MEKEISERLKTLGFECTSYSPIRRKDGVNVIRVFRGEESFVLKYFDRPAKAREIVNYRILSSLGIETIGVAGMTDDALLLEDIGRSSVYRLGEEADMQDTRVAASLAGWYRKLHQKGRAYVEEHGAGMYDESELITPDNLAFVRDKTGTAGNALWDLLPRHFDAFISAAEKPRRTLTYNDFYYTNLVVARDCSSAFMFDYHLLGKGYVFGDLFNVTSALGKEAKEAFLTAYGEYDRSEEPVHRAVGPLVALISACQRERFPDWGYEDLEKLNSGMLAEAVKAVLRQIV